MLQEKEAKLGLYGPEKWLEAMLWQTQLDVQNITVNKS